jgi:hypothetical protein
MEMGWRVYRVLPLMKDSIDVLQLAPASTIDDFCNRCFRGIVGTVARPAAILE